MIDFLVSSKHKMIVSRKGRTFQSGKALSDDLRKLVIDRVVQAGGDVVTGFFPGSFNQIAEQLKISRSTVQKLWSQCTETADIGARWAGGNNPPRLQGQTLDLIEGLKAIQPSMPYRKILDEVNANCYIPGGTSKSAVARAVQHRLEGGKRTWKRMSRATAEKLNPQNVQWCQNLLNFLNGVDPYRVKCFDESGFRMPDVCRPNYGHSVVNTPCIEIGRYINAPNVTLNLLIGLQGVLYANTEDGATDTQTFLNFWGETAANAMPNGRPILEYGDIILMHNCATHHYAGGYALAEWLDERGIDVLHLPVYSPELNPVELVFNKLKILSKQGNMRAIFNRNIHEGIYECLERVTALDCNGFYRKCEYFDI